MKKAFYVALGMLFALSAFAQPSTPPAGAPGGPPQDFGQLKQRLLERMDRRIDAIQKERSCVQLAQDAQALRSCRPPGRRERGGPGGPGGPR